MNTKCFTLLSEKEEGGSWGIVCRIKRNGMVLKKGSFEIQSLKKAREYYERKKERIKEKRKEYRRSNKDKIKDCQKEYDKKYYEKNPNYYKAKRDFRARNLGYEPLNASFEDSEGHHMDENLVMYIPKEFHRYIYHNVFTGGGMDEINGQILVRLGKERGEKE